MREKKKKMSVIEPNTTWKCVSAFSEFENVQCILVDVDNNPDLNGDGDVEVLYENGEKAFMKLRKFLDRHTYIYPRRLFFQNQTLGGNKNA